MLYMYANKEGSARRASRTFPYRVRDLLSLCRPLPPPLLHVGEFDAHFKRAEKSVFAVSWTNSRCFLWRASR